MTSGLGDTPLEGSTDEAAAAIEALFNRPAGETAPEPGADPDEEEIAAQIEGAMAPEPANTVEEAPVGETPSPAPQGDTTPQAKVEPPPVIKPAPQAAAQPAEKPLTAQDQLAQLNQLVPILQGQLTAQFPDIKSQDDLIRLAAEDPGRYIVYQAHERRIQIAQGHQANAQSAYQAEWDARETTRLKELLPEIADPEKGPPLVAKLRDFAKGLGYSDQQIRWAAASDVKMLHDAMQYRDRAAADAAKAAADAKALKEAQAKAADAPPVQKPGVAKVTDKKAEKTQELTERFQKSGHPDDLALLLQAAGLS